jgi:hypothetical protein
VSAPGRLKRFRVEQREDGSAWWVFDFECAEFRPKSHVEDFMGIVNALKSGIGPGDREWHPDGKRWVVRATPACGLVLCGIFRNFGEELGKIELQGSLAL